MKLSVYIPTVRSTTLAAAVQSILRQTWSDWELVLVGQGPAPTLRSLGQAVADSDRRIRYIHLDQPLLSRARNAGIAATTGDIVAMMDDDCEARADWLATIAEYFSSEPRVEVVSGSLI